jgi:hypothetical protein
MAAKKKATKAEIEAERARFNGLTQPEADWLYVAAREQNPSRYKTVVKYMPKFIAEGFWDPAAPKPGRPDLLGYVTPLGLEVVRKAIQSIYSGTGLPPGDPSPTERA